MLFWNTTPPTTTDSDIAMLCRNSKDAVAAAVSAWLTVFWIAAVGAWKRSAGPRAPTIPNPTTIATDVPAPKVMYSPVPIAMSSEPAHINSL